MTAKQASKLPVAEQPAWFRPRPVPKQKPVVFTPTPLMKRMDVLAHRARKRQPQCKATIATEGVDSRGRRYVQLSNGMYLKG